jgi:hypothetical protein
MAKKLPPAKAVDRLGLSIRIAPEDFEKLQALRLKLVASGRKPNDSRIFLIALQSLRASSPADLHDFVARFDKLDELDRRRHPELG